MRRRGVALLVAAVAGAMTTGAGFAVDRAVRDEGVAYADDVVGPGLVTINVHIRYSKFEFDATRVAVGSLVRFVVVNEDPIHHELVIGPERIHRQHRVGTERAHPPVPGEVSVGPNDTAVTVFRFERVGPVRYACHLAGHEAFGMLGAIEVIDGTRNGAADR